MFIRFFYALGRIVLPTLLTSAVEIELELVVDDFTGQRVYWGGLLIAYSVSALAAVLQGELRWGRPAGVAVFRTGEKPARALPLVLEFRLARHGFSGGAIGYRVVAEDGQAHGEDRLYRFKG